MKRILLSLFFFLGSAFFSTVSYAEEIRIGLGNQGSETLRKKLPDRGLSQSQIVAEYGEPLSRKGPTGKPPIETWHYDYFSVYFENDYVIHSVIKHVRKDGHE